MIKVKVIAGGKAKDPWLVEALNEYQKRLLGRMEIEWRDVKTTQEFLKESAKESFLIVLDLKGKRISSEELSGKLFHEWGARPTFVIGGPEGLPSEMLLRAKFLWSLSPLTFTHSMVRLLLIEQLYRAVEIEKGTPYHK